MCCLFGLLDYGHSLTAAQKNHILAVLSTVCEARGTDATESPITPITDCRSISVHFLLTTFDCVFQRTPIMSWATQE